MGSMLSIYRERKKVDMTVKIRAKQINKRDVKPSKVSLIPKNPLPYQHRDVASKASNKSKIYRL